MARKPSNKKGLQEMRISLESIEAKFQRHHDWNDIISNGTQADKIIARQAKTKQQAKEACYVRVKETFAGDAYRPDGKAVMKGKAKAPKKAYRVPRGVKLKGEK